MLPTEDMSDRARRVWNIAGVLLLAVVLFILWPRVEPAPGEIEARAQGRVILTYWDRHSGHEYDARVTLIDEFNRSQNKIYVRPTPIGSNSLMEKILTSTAGGDPPDLVLIDSTYLAQLAPQGLFMPLDDFIASDADIHQDTFYPHCWRMVHFDGHTWGIPLGTDTYCLVWNKNAFRKAGLDPDRPPKSLKELEDYSAKLTVRGANGVIEQMGFLPWLPWDLTHLWGVFFGGTWNDPVTGQCNIEHDPNIIASLKWQQSFTVDPARKEQLSYAMDPDRIASFSKASALGDYFSANNPFYSGKVAMLTEGEWQCTFIPRYAPGLDWGVAAIPQPEGAPVRGYGPQADNDAIPTTSRHPEEAKTFLRWFYAKRPNGGTSPASDFVFAIHNVPARKAEAAEPRFVNNPKFRVFVEQLNRPDVLTLPISPVTQYMLDELERERERVVFREVSPEQAAHEIQDYVNEALDRVRKQMRAAATRREAAGKKS